MKKRPKIVMLSNEVLQRMNNKKREEESRGSTEVQACLQLNAVLDLSAIVNLPGHDPVDLKPVSVD